MKFGIAASPGSSTSGVALPPPPDTGDTGGTGGTGGTGSGGTTTPPPSGTGVVSSATTLYFGSSATQSVTYTNNTGSKVTFIQASISSAKYGQSNNCGEVAAGASCTATVTYYPSNSGSDTATFTMTSTAPNSPHLVTLTNTSAPVTPPPTSGGVTMSATTLDFRNGAKATQTVTYTNNTGSKVTFIQASISSGKFGQTNNCGEVAAGASCTATVTWYRSRSGSDTATFTMTSTAPNSPHVVSLKASSSKPYISG
jgi:hypothetical protein